jgi:hypothetical protein
MPDLSAREWLMLGPIAAAVLWMGVYPESFLAPMRADIQALDARVARAKPDGDARLAVAPVRITRLEDGRVLLNGQPATDKHVVTAIVAGETEAGPEVQAVVDAMGEGAH